MCLILMAYQTHPSYPLIIVANRDEFFQRPTERAHWWTQYPDMLAGRDIRGNGSWLGVGKSGRFAALTNYRDGFDLKKNAPTRGALVTRYINEIKDTEAYFEALKASAELYNGYNLLTYDGQRLSHFSNINQRVTEITPGIHGLSNALLNSDWQKINKGKAKLEALVARITKAAPFDIDAAFDMMLDEAKAPDDLLPQTGVPYEWEKELSSMCIKTETYGTRCSTVVVWDKQGGIYFEERSYVPNLGSVVFVF